MSWNRKQIQRKSFWRRKSVKKDSQNLERGIVVSPENMERATEQYCCSNTGLDARMKRARHTLGIALVFSGFSAIFGSLAIVCLDSIGYWNSPKNFLDALFTLGFELTGLGIQGLQMFHYLVGGVVLLVFGVGLFASTRGAAHAPLPEELVETQNMNELKERILLLEREKEDLKSRLREYERRPSTLTSYMLLAVGAVAFISATIYSSFVLAFIGVGLTFWGALLLYIRPTGYAKISLLNSTALSSLTAIGQVVKELGMKGKAIYLPPRYLRELKGGSVFIPKEKGDVIPPMNETERTNTPMNPRGLYLTPPGIGLANLYEKELGRHFAETDLRYLQFNLPRLFKEDLEIVENLEMKSEGAIIQVKMEGAIYRDLYKEIKTLSPNVFNTLGCPLTSSIAVAIARTTGNPVIIEENEVSADGKKIAASFRRLETVESRERTDAVETVESYSRLVASSLSVLGSTVLAWVGWLIWNDITVGGKSILLILYGSRTGEAIDLGIGMKIVYYLLIGLLLLLSGLLAFLKRRGKA